MSVAATNRVGQDRFAAVAFSHIATASLSLYHDRNQEADPLLRYTIFRDLASSAPSSEQRTLWRDNGWQAAVRGSSARATRSFLASRGHVEECNAVSIAAGASWLAF
jgi:hypothetical protein